MKTYKQFVTESMNASLVDSIVQMTERCIRDFKHFHWNVKGGEFLPLHELFGEIYRNLTEFQDRLAEKIRGAGFPVIIKSIPESEVVMDIEGVRTNSRNILSEYRVIVGLASGQDLGLDNILGELAEKIDSWVYKIKSCYA